jgi:hypothetical protein
MAKYKKTCPEPVEGSKIFKIFTKTCAYNYLQPIFSKTPAQIKDLWQALF